MQNKLIYSNIDSTIIFSQKITQWQRKEEIKVKVKKKVAFIFVFYSNLTPSEIKNII